MPLAPKPKSEVIQLPVDQEEAINAVINKGLAGPAEAEVEEEEKEQQVVIFLSKSLLADVDALAKATRPKTSRRQWLVEAVREKVERDKDVD